jgi:hypothetical protein
VKRDTALVSRLNDALNLDAWQATRWRTIAAQSRPLKSIQRCLPPAFEPIYEVARTLKRNEKRVLKAVEDETLTPSSTMREIRDIGKHRAGSRTTRHEWSPKSSRINVGSLKSIGMTFLFPLDTVPRWDDIEELREQVGKVLAKYKARYAGLASVAKAGPSPDDDTVQQRLETYWALKDEAATIKQSGTADEKADLEDRWNKLIDGGKVW